MFSVGDENSDHGLTITNAEMDTTSPPGYTYAPPSPSEILQSLPLSRSPSLSLSSTIVRTPSSRLARSDAAMMDDSPAPFPGNITRSPFSSPATFHLPFPLSPSFPDPFPNQLADDHHTYQPIVAADGGPLPLRAFSTLTAASTLLDLAASPSPSPSPSKRGRAGTRTGSTPPAHKRMRTHTQNNTGLTPFASRLSFSPGRTATLPSPHSMCWSPFPSPTARPKRGRGVFSPSVLGQGSFSSAGGSGSGSFTSASGSFASASSGQAGPPAITASWGWKTVTISKEAEADSQSTLLASPAPALFPSPEPMPTFFASPSPPSASATGLYASPTSGLGIFVSPLMPRQSAASTHRGTRRRPLADVERPFESPLPRSQSHDVFSSPPPWTSSQTLLPSSPHAWASSQTFLPSSPDLPSSSPTSRPSSPASEYSACDHDDACEEDEDQTEIRDPDAAHVVGSDDDDPGFAISRNTKATAPTTAHIAEKLSSPVKLNPTLKRKRKPQQSYVESRAREERDTTYAGTNVGSSVPTMGTEGAYIQGVLPVRRAAADARRRLARYIDDSDDESDVPLRQKVSVRTAAHGRTGATDNAQTRKKEQDAEDEFWGAKNVLTTNKTFGQSTRNDPRAGSSPAPMQPVPAKSAAARDVGILAPAPRLGRAPPDSPSEDEQKDTRIRLRLLLSRARAAAVSPTPARPYAKVKGAAFFTSPARRAKSTSGPTAREDDKDDTPLPNPSPTKPPSASLVTPPRTYSQDPFASPLSPLTPVSSTGSSPSREGLVLAPFYASASPAHGPGHHATSPGGTAALRAHLRFSLAHVQESTSADDVRAFARTRGQARVLGVVGLASSSTQAPAARATVKRARVDGAQPGRATKRARESVSASVVSAPAAPASEDAENGPVELEPELGIDGGPQVTFPPRTLPSAIPVHASFPQWYRRFPVPAPVDESQLKFTGYLTGATFNPPRTPYDLYIPRFVKGRGSSKVGLCPLCAEPRKRGGEGKKVWLSMKFSAFKCYHMQYYHGVSTAGNPFSPPIAFRTVQTGTTSKHEKVQLEQGRCHRCNKWVNVEGIKDVEVKVPEIYWWKHAATCHQGSPLPGETDVFIEDAVLSALQDAGEGPSMSQ